MGVFLGLYLAMPEQWGMTFAVDTRLVPALLVCTLARLGTLPAARWSWAGVNLLGAALILRSGDVWQAWQRLDRRLQEAARSFEHLEFQARVLPVILTPAVLKENPEHSFVSLAVIAQHAYVPTLFAVRDQQPLRLTAGTKLATPFVHFPAGTIVVRPDAETADCAV